MAKAELNWAVAASGSGSTMEKMAQAVESGEVSGVRLELLIVNNARVGAIERAKKLGLEPGQIAVLNPNDFKGEDGEVDMDGFGRAMIEVLRGHNIDFMTQNGWLKKTPERVVEEFPVFNQHPQDPRYFGGEGMYGLRPHAARLIYAQMTGEHNPEVFPVVHRATKEFDKGPVVVYNSTRIPVEVTSETLEFAAPALQKVVLPLEHLVNVEFLNQMAAGTLHDVQLPDMAPVRLSKGRGTVDQWADLSRTRAVEAFPHA